MNKDALLATFIGFIVGLIITGLILLGPSLLAHLPKITLPTISLPTSAPKSSPTAAQPKDFSLTIDSPLADSIENETTILVSGSTSPQSTVVMQTENDETVVVANAEGKYAGEITFIEGRNMLTVTAYLLQEQKTVERVLYVLKEDF